MNQFRSPLFWLILGGLCVVGAFAWQQRSIHHLGNEVARLQAVPPTVVEETPSAPAERMSPPVFTPQPTAAVEVAPDREARLQYYRAFDDVNDPSFMLPLVEGAQDADAELRRLAMDALIDYRSEPAIADLLKAMAESDPDPGVRREAARIYRNGRR